MSTGRFALFLPSPLPPTISSSPNMSPPFYNQVFTPAVNPIPTSQLYDSFPADFDFSKPQAAVRPLPSLPISILHGFEGSWKC